MAIPERRTRLVISLDFGTTQTGIALIRATEGQNETGDGQYAATEPQIEDVTSWKECANPKVPSEISYSPAKGLNDQWGAQFADNAFRFVWTKLGLEDRSCLEELKALRDSLDGMADLDFRNIADSNGLPEYPAKEPVDIVTDFLSCVREHFIKHDILQMYVQEAFDLLSIDLVVTCPAGWSANATNKTFRAITKAGFNKTYFKGLNNIVLVSEPNAAALYVIKCQMSEDDEFAVKAGDCFVHCDAGGGTVDVSAFRVNHTVPDIQMDEICLQQGRKCGSTFIDRAFQKLLRERLGDQNYRILAYGMLEEDRVENNAVKIKRRAAGNAVGGHTIIGPYLRRMMDELEGLKRSFNGEDDIDHFIALPGVISHLEDAENGIGSGMIRISARDIRKAFAYSVKHTKEVIIAQVSQVRRTGSSVKFVSLSGGFACSDYLFDQVKRELQTHKIPLIRPTDGSKTWPAVARGAAWYGLLPVTTQHVFMRACVRNYGVRTSQLFSEFKHSDPETPTYIDRLDRKRKAEYQMTWLARKGDLVLSTEGKYSTVQICRKFRAGESRNFCNILLANDDDDPPHGHLENEFRQVATLNYDLSRIDLALFERTSPRIGRAFLVAYLTLHLLIKDDKMRFWVTFDGYRKNPVMGTVTVPYA